MSSTLCGGCFCGYVRYEASGRPRHETHCHCTICRRTTGAAFLSWFTVAASSFRFTRGVRARFQSSEHGTREFCPRCGTQLTFRSTQTPDEVDVTIGSLDQPEMVRPRDHTWVESALEWTPRASLPAFPKARPE